MLLQSSIFCAWCSAFLYSEFCLFYVGQPSSPFGLVSSPLAFLFLSFRFGWKSNIRFCHRGSLEVLLFAKALCKWNMIWFFLFNRKLVLLSFELWRGPWIFLSLLWCPLHFALDFMIELGVIYYINLNRPLTLHVFLISFELQTLQLPWSW